MIYLLLFWEFFQIGLLAVGGGLVTVPFLFDLSDKYAWFTPQELTDMIAVSQSTPGPIGINMATFAGFKIAGISGSLIATLGEILPSMIVVFLIAKMLAKWHENMYVNKVLEAVRPAILALILFAGWDIAKITITDYKNALILFILLTAMRLYKTSAIFYIIIAAVIGITFKI